MIDFDQLFGDDDELPTNPRDIFALLNKDDRFTFLRDVQSDVLDGWYKDPKRKDVIVKLNTGAGKTTVGLLMLQSSLNEGVSPAVYLTPDKYLTEQVIAEAKALGIDATDDEKDSRVRAGTAILVTNVFKLFNGRSVFGVGRGGIKIHIGTIVIDDAHASLATMSQQFRIKLPNTHPAFAKIGQLFESSLRTQSLPATLAIMSGDPHDYLEVPFWTLREKSEDLLSILREYKDTEELMFSYSLLAEHLNLCRVIIGGQELEVAPLFPLPSMVPAFANAKRRIYMSATLADDSVFVTHFGAQRQELSDPITPEAAHAMGDRMILFPNEFDRSMDRAKLKELLVDFAKERNVVVIVPSKRGAEDWRPSANSVLMGENVSAGVAKLRSGHVGLTVLVNRYDGIDLPYDACRILVIDGLPEAASLSERVDGTILGSGSIGLRRQVERIEQGMGRGVRAADDHCVVLLLGAKLTERLLSQEGRSILSKITLAQIDLAQRLGEQLADSSVEELKRTMMLCLEPEKNKKWQEGSRKVRARVRPDGSLRLDETSVALREAFDAALLDDDPAAAEIVQREVTRADDPFFKAWLLQRLALHLEGVDSALAQVKLTEARSLNLSVLRPRGRVVYKSLARNESKQAVLSQAALQSHLEAVDRIRFVDGLADDLVFRPDTADIFEQAIDDVGKLIGLVCQRPEKLAGEGPDNLWYLHGNRFLVIECKNGVTSKEGISKKDLGQLQQSMSWFAKHYGSAMGVPVIIHPHSKLGPAASLPVGARVISPKKLKLLKKDVTEFVTNISADDGRVRDVEQIANLLSVHHLRADLFVERFSEEIG